MKNIAVIGAGAAGISAAYRLQKRGFNATVFEANSIIGGRCRSIKQDGFLFDIGAGIIPSTYSHVINLMDELGIKDEIQPYYSVIGTLRDNVVHHIDSKKPSTFLTAKHLSAKSKLTLLKFVYDLVRASKSMNFYDLSTAAHLDTETVAQYCKRRLNDELFDYFIAPLCRSLFLVEPEHSSIVDLFCSAKSVLTASHLAGHPKGIGYFLEVAAQQLNIKLDSKVLNIEDREGNSEVLITWQDSNGQQTSAFDKCIITLPAHQMISIYPQLDQQRRTYLQNLEYSSSIMVQLGLGQRTDETAGMLLIPRDIEPDLPIVALTHNLSPERAPEKKSALTAYWMSGWSKKEWQTSDDTLIQTTVNTINRLSPNLANNLESSLVTRWETALVAATPGIYKGQIDFSKRCLPNANIQLAGDYLAQTSVNSSVASGERAADNIIKSV